MVALGDLSLPKIKCYWLVFSSVCLRNSTYCSREILVQSQAECCDNLIFISVGVLLAWTARWILVQKPNIEYLKEPSCKKGGFLAFKILGRLEISPHHLTESQIFFVLTRYSTSAQWIMIDPSKGFTTTSTLVCHCPLFIYRNCRFPPISLLLSWTSVVNRNKFIYLTIYDLEADSLYLGNSPLTTPTILIVGFYRTPGMGDS